MNKTAAVTFAVERRRLPCILPLTGRLRDQGKQLLRFGRHILQSLHKVKVTVNFGSYAARRSRRTDFIRHGRRSQSSSRIITIIAPALLGKETSEAPLSMTASPLSNSVSPRNKPLLASDLPMEMSTRSPPRSDVSPSKRHGRPTI